MGKGQQKQIQTMIRKSVAPNLRCVYMGGGRGSVHPHGECMLPNCHDSGTVMTRAFCVVAIESAVLNYTIVVYGASGFPKLRIFGHFEPWTLCTSGTFRTKAKLVTSYHGQGTRWLSAESLRTFSWVPWYLHNVYSFKQLKGRYTFGNYSKQILTLKLTW